MRFIGVGSLVVGLALQTQLVSLGQDGLQAREEFVFYADTDVVNPIADVDVEATFRNDSGTEVTVSGFWDGDSTFRVRFAPSSLGSWTYLTTSNSPPDLPEPIT